MEIDLHTIQPCFLHKKEILYVCCCSTCNIPNPFICGDPLCLKVHGHPQQQIVALSKLAELLQRNTSSMMLLMKKMKEYYKQIRESLCHEIEKTEQMMLRALQYKHTHQTINLFKDQKYNEINPQKMAQLVCYLSGAKTERKSMEFIKNEIYESVQKLDSLRRKLLEGPQYKRLMLFQLIDLKSTSQISIQNINTTLLSEQQFKAINRMLKERSKKIPTNLQMIYRASENQFLNQPYLLSIQGRGPLLFLFQSQNDKKFGAFLNIKVDKKQGWITDGAGFSFIFSLDFNMIYPIKQDAKFRVKAFYIGNKGPQIGCGCDIYISNKCNENTQSGSNLGGSFELPSKYVYSSKEAQSYLAGLMNFKINEYQVFEVK